MYNQRLQNFDSLNYLNCSNLINVSLFIMNEGNRASKEDIDLENAIGDVFGQFDFGSVDKEKARITNYNKTN